MINRLREVGDVLQTASSFINSLIGFGLLLAHGNGNVVRQTHGCLCLVTKWVAKHDFHKQSPSPHPAGHVGLVWWPRCQANFRELLENLRRSNRWQCSVLHNYLKRPVCLVKLGQTETIKSRLFWARIDYDERLWTIFKWKPCFRNKFCIFEYQYFFILSEIEEFY